MSESVKSSFDLELTKSKEDFGVDQVEKDDYFIIGQAESMSFKTDDKILFINDLKSHRHDRNSAVFIYHVLIL